MAPSANKSRIYGGNPARQVLIDAIARSLALFSILLGFTLPFSVALAGPTNGSGAALCLSGYGTTQGTSPFSTRGNTSATAGDSCLLCVSCHTPAAAEADTPRLAAYIPSQSGVIQTPITLEIRDRRNKGETRVRAPPTTL